MDGCLAMDDRPTEPLERTNLPLDLILLFLEEILEFSTVSYSIIELRLFADALGVATLEVKIEAALLIDDGVRLSDGVVYIVLVAACTSAVFSLLSKISCRLLLISGTVSDTNAGCNDLRDIDLCNLLLKPCVLF